MIQSQIVTEIDCIDNYLLNVKQLTNKYTDSNLKSEKSDLNKKREIQQLQPSGLERNIITLLLFETVQSRRSEFETWQGLADKAYTN